MEDTHWINFIKSHYVVCISSSADSLINLEMSRFLRKMLSHTYRLYGDSFIDKTWCEFSLNENAALSYSTTQKAIVSKLFMDHPSRSVLCKVF